MGTIEENNFKQDIVVTYRNILGNTINQKISKYCVDNATCAILLLDPFTLGIEHIAPY